MFFIAWKFRTCASPQLLMAKTFNTSSLVFLQVFDQPDEVETGGMYFPMAMDNLCTCPALVHERG